MKTFALSLVLLFSLAIIAPSIAQDAAAPAAKKECCKKADEKACCAKEKEACKKECADKKDCYYQLNHPNRINGMQKRVCRQKRL